METKVAVVILNWNGEEMLRRFLPSVLACSVAEGAVVYVADNASTDRSLQMLSEEFPDVRRLALERNYGFAEGYNRALKQVQTEYYVLLNSDVEVTEHWLKPLVAYLDAHPEVAACQPKILSWHTKDMFEYAGACGGFIDHYGYPYCRGRIFDTVERDEGQYEETVPVFWASGAALFIRSEAYWRAGGLDDRFFAHMEEIDLCWRLRSRGQGVVCIPQSVVYHVGGATLKKGNPYKTFLNFRNNLLMLYKNLPEHGLHRILFVRGLLDYAAALAFLMKGQATDAWAVCRARRAYRKMRKEFADDRATNLRATVSATISERSDDSILVQYYWKRKVRFSCLAGK